MFDINNPNIPLMSDEGLTQVMLLYEALYNEGTYYLRFNHYISNIINLSTAHDSKDNNIEEFNSLQEHCCIQEIGYFIDAVIEDVNNYGLEEFIKLKRRQSNDAHLLACLNTTDILAAMRYPKNMIKENIENNEIHKLPKLIQYLYKEYNTIDEKHGGLNTLPYFINKEVFDDNHIGQGRQRFRVYLNNPMGKSGVAFYLIFIKKLIEQRIPYNDKYNYNASEDRKDKSIFYFPIEYLNEVTQMLDEIQIEYPEIVSNFGTPPMVCAQTSYYGVAHTGASINIKNRTYNMYVNDITYIAYFIYYCKQFLMNGAVFVTLTEEEKAVVKKYAQGVLNESVFNEIVKPLTNTSFSKDSGIIKQIISKYHDKFKVAIQPKDYRYILKQVNSARMYGDLEHLDYPICFNETFYGASLDSTKKR